MKIQWSWPTVLGHPPGPVIMNIRTQTSTCRIKLKLAIQSWTERIRVFVLTIRFTSLELINPHLTSSVEFRDAFKLGAGICIARVARDARVARVTLACPPTCDDCNGCESRSGCHHPAVSNPAAPTALSLSGCAFDDPVVVPEHALPTDARRIRLKATHPQPSLEPSHGRRIGGIAQQAEEAATAAGARELRGEALAARLLAHVLERGRRDAERRKQLVIQLDEPPKRRVVRAIEARPPPPLPNPILPNRRPPPLRHEVEEGIGDRSDRLENTRGDPRVCLVQRAHLGHLLPSPPRHERIREQDAYGREVLDGFECERRAGRRSAEAHRTAVAAHRIVEP